MKKSVIKGLIFVLLIFMWVLPTAFAGRSIGEEGKNTARGSPGLEERLRNVPDFKFFHQKNGIGYGVCPVYTAPSEDSFRMANGKACVATDFDMYECGFDETGWLFVRYDTNNGSTNTGYIPPQYVRGFHSQMTCKNFEYIPATVEKTIRMTNNPLLRGSAFAVLDPGETFHILAKYTYHGDWWYIECTVDGQLARGFIDRQESSFYLGDRGLGAYKIDATNTLNLGKPKVSPLGTYQIGEVIVDGGTTDKRIIVREDQDAGSALAAYVNPDDRFPCYAINLDKYGIEWYYIWIESAGKWGWISSGISTLCK